MDYSHCNITLVGSHVDWLTCTARGTDRTTALWKIGTDLLDEQEQRGQQVRDFRFRQFKGWQAGSVSVGLSDSHAICQVTGEDADPAFDLVHGASDHVSRIDLAVTARLDPYVPGLQHQAYNEALSIAKTGEHHATFEYHASSRAGATFYVGAPDSDQRGRYYDKSLESGEERYADCYRWETQNRNHYSDGVARIVSLASDRRATIQRYVHDYFTKRGVLLPWRTDTDYVPTGYQQSESNIITKLRWLRRQVAPTVKWLCQRGQEHEVYEALGLSEGDEGLAYKAG